MLTKDTKELCFKYKKLWVRATNLQIGWNQFSGSISGLEILVAKE